MKKRFLAYVLTAALVFTGVCFMPEKGKLAKAETQNSEVNTDMLQVKVQVSSGQSAMRFITSVDSLDYVGVGFEITPEGGEPISYTTSTVYERIESYENGLEYQFGSKVVDITSEYLVTAKMKVATEKLYTVRAFVVTKSGTTVYGDYRCVALEDGVGDTVNLSFISNDATIKIGDVLNDITYGTTEEKTTGTVIGVNGNTVHVRIAVQPNELSSATKFVFGNAGSAIYRNLYTEYEGTADTSWYDIYMAEDVDADAFVIATNADLYGLASIVNAGTSLENKTVYMCSDIALNDADAVTWSSGTVASGVTPYEWTPIGTAREGSDTGYKDALVKPFSGTFDGREHIVRGIYINQGTLSWRALFGATSSEATVKNFRVVDSYIFGRAMSAGIAAAGNGTFENLYCEATIISNASTCSGGIVGRCDVSAVTVKNCWFNGTLSTARNGEAQTGGIVGRITVSGSKLENCLNSGSVTASAATSAVGGLIGKNAANVEIIDCLSVGTVKANAGQGSLIGSVASGTSKVVDTYSLTSACTNAIGTGSVVDASSVAIADTTTLQVASDDMIGTVTTSKLIGMDFESIWATVISSTPILLQFEDMVNTIVLDVSWYDEEKDTYVLYDRADLYGLSQLVNSGITFEGKTVKLGADIVLNPGNANHWATKAPHYNWNPIGYRNGSGAFIGFNGIFDGDMHTISGLYLNTNQRFTGLFGVIGSSAVIQNVKLVNSYLNATAADTGAVVGIAQGGKLLNVYTDATVKNTSGRIGGLIGQINNSTTLERCWFDGKVTCTGNGNGLRATGGFVGVTVTTGTVNITNCLNTGIVNASAYEYVQMNTMVNCVAGGMVGQVGASTTVNLSNCLNTTDILVSDKATVGYGPVIGYVDGSKTITNVYSIDTCKMSTNGKPTDTYSLAELTGSAAANNLNGFDFTNVWKIVENGTPILR